MKEIELVGGIGKVYVDEDASYIMAVKSDHVEDCHVVLKGKGGTLKEMLFKTLGHMMERENAFEQMADIMAGLACIKNVLDPGFELYAGVNGNKISFREFVEFADKQKKVH
jgi:hypothetical protein